MTVLMKHQPTPCGFPHLKRPAWELTQRLEADNICVQGVGSRPSKTAEIRASAICGPLNAVIAVRNWEPVELQNDVQLTELDVTLFWDTKTPGYGIREIKIAFGRALPSVSKKLWSVYLHA